ncbi:MAG: hypothetical protein R3E65_00730 [Steroidobacteraceae bacterium]
MFIIPDRGRAVLLTLLLVGLAVALSACTTTRPAPAQALRADCPAGDRSVPGGGNPA